MLHHNAWNLGKIKGISPPILLVYMGSNSYILLLTTVSFFLWCRTPFFFCSSVSCYCNRFQRVLCRTSGFHICIFSYVAFTPGNISVQPDKLTFLPNTLKENMVFLSFIFKHKHRSYPLFWFHSMLHNTCFTESPSAGNDKITWNSHHKYKVHLMNLQHKCSFNSLNIEP